MRIWILLASCAAMAAGCGGQVSGSPDGGGDKRASSASSSGSASNSSSSSGGSSSGSGGSGGSGGGSGSSGGPVPLCPPDPPTVNVSCASPGQGCAYFLNGECEGYRCQSSGWEMDPTVTCP